MSKKRSKTHFKPFLSFTHTKPLVICYRIRYAHLLNPKHNTKASFALHLGLRFIFIVQRCTNFEERCTDFEKGALIFIKKIGLKAQKSRKALFFIFYIFILFSDRLEPLFARVADFKYVEICRLICRNLSFNM
ncbi:hypothetical protein [Haemophilus haemolyticus]|uniref:hypothetical protein n=1 Tax=Haemophilus haemolyticus TaxID=726 RepID=UPI0012DB1B28|nr:hypothetical protein [Haemophilus haemolyticus]